MLGRCVSSPTHHPTLCFLPSNPLRVIPVWSNTPESAARGGFVSMNGRRWEPESAGRWQEHSMVSSAPLLEIRKCAVPQPPATNVTSFSRLFRLPPSTLISKGCQGQMLVCDAGILACALQSPDGTGIAEPSDAQAYSDTPSPPPNMEENRTHLHLQVQCQRLSRSASEIARKWRGTNMPLPPLYTDFTTITIRSSHQLQAGFGMQAQCQSLNMCGLRAASSWR